MIKGIFIAAKCAAIMTFIIGWLYIAEYCGEPTKIELSEPFCWLGYSAVFAVLARVMGRVNEEITNK